MQPRAFSLRTGKELSRDDLSRFMDHLQPKMHTARSKARNMEELRVEAHVFGRSLVRRMALYDWLSTPRFPEGFLAMVHWAYYLGAHFSFLAR